SPAAGKDRAREGRPQEGHVGGGQRDPLQGPGRDEPVAAARIDHPSRHPPAGAADHRRRRPDALADGRAAGEEARRGSEGVAGGEGGPRDAGGLADGSATLRRKPEPPGRPYNPLMHRDPLPLWPLPLLVALVPFVAAHVAYAISIDAGHVPACMPYVEGCTSISRAARHGLGNLVFRPLMLPCALLLALPWLAARRWLRL